MVVDIVPNIINAVMLLEITSFKTNPDACQDVTVHAKDSTGKLSHTLNLFALSLVSGATTITVCGVTIETFTNCQVLWLQPQFVVCLLT